ncbi:MAG: hypothetical protein K0R61_290 [Microvirga sp.]|nr:hypothetical protein [Microvirga sp.]
MMHPVLNVHQLLFVATAVIALLRWSIRLAPAHPSVAVKQPADGEDVVVCFGAEASRSGACGRPTDNERALVTAGQR